MDIFRRRERGVIEKLEGQGIIPGRCSSCGRSQLEVSTNEGDQAVLVSCLGCELQWTLWRDQASADPERERMEEAEKS